MAVKKPSRMNRPAETPDAREQQMINYAVDLAEKQLIEGTAKTQVIVHYLRLATVKAQLEKEKLENENALLRAKKDAIDRGQELNANYAEALEAFRKYSGQKRILDESEDDGLGWY